MRFLRSSCVVGVLTGMAATAPVFAQGSPSPGPSADAPSTPPAAPAATTVETGVGGEASPTPASPAPPGPGPATPPTAGTNAPAGIVEIGLSGPEWSQGYARARERMVAGDFATAAPMFEQLAATARHPYDRGVALELARLCTTWQQRGLVFVRREDLGESSVRARAADERTGDEIASLYLASVGYGIGTGAWLAVQTEPGSLAGGILPALALTGAAAGGVAALDSGRPMRYGVPQSIVTGLGLGFYEGLLWTTWNQARVNRDDEWDGKTVATVIWGTATAGALTGGIVGHVKGTTPGRASFVGSTAMWTAAVSGLTVGAFSNDDDSRDDKALLAASVGLNAGALGGMFAAGQVSPSIARVRFLDLGAIGGGMLFSGLYLSAAGEGSDESAFMAVSAAGIASGLATAWIFTTGMEKDRGAREQTTAVGLPVDVHPALVPIRGGMGLGLQGTL